MGILDTATGDKSCLSDKIVDLRQLPETILSQVLNLITGLSLDEVRAVGGYSLHNPITGEDVANLALAYV